MICFQFKKHDVSSMLSSFTSEDASMLLRAISCKISLIWLLKKRPDNFMSRCSLNFWLEKITLDCENVLPINCFCETTSQTKPSRMLECWVYNCVAYYVYCYLASLLEIKFKSKLKNAWILLFSNVYTLKLSLCWSLKYLESISFAFLSCMFIG